MKNNFDEVLNVQLLNVTFSLVYPSAGTYHPTVVVTDDEGDESSALVSITVKCIPQFFCLNFLIKSFGNL